MRLAITCLASLAALTLAAAGTPATAIDTIDCSRDHSAAERAICASQRLQVLDAQVTQAYADIMLSPRIDSSVKDAVRDSQYVFLRRRESCGRDSECLTEVMQLRASRINFYR